MDESAGKRREWRVALLLLALTAFFFWRLWLAPDGFIYPPTGRYSDLTVTHWPNALFIRRSLALYGQVPLWKPLILSGEPFSANPLSGLWYPPNLLLLVLPLNLAFNVLAILHTAWAGWGGYRLVRALGASSTGAYLAALALAFAPKALAHLGAGHVGLFCAWAWLPWTLWAVRSLVEHTGLTEVATTAVAAAMLTLADVRLGLYGAALAGGYWVWCTLGRLRRDGKQRRPVQLVACSTLAAVLGGALLAVDVLPLLAVAPRLNRGALSLAESAAFSLPPRYLVGLLVAAHGGTHEWMTYAGAVVLALAVVGLLRWPSRERWWWGGVMVAAAVYALGSFTPVYGLLVRVLPALGWLRVPARSWFLFVIAAAVLAARGLSALAQPASRRRPVGRALRARLLLTAALAGAALAGVLGSLALHLPANVAVATVLWPLSGALLVLRSAGLVPRLWFGYSVLGLAAADLWVAGLTLCSVRPAQDVFAEGAVAAGWLADQPGLFRVYSPSYSIPQHTGARYGIETADGVDPFQLGAYSAFMRVATGVDGEGYSVTIPPFARATGDDELLMAHRDVVPNLQWLGLLNVRYLAAAYPLAADGLVALGEHGGVYLYQNERAMPRAFVVQRVEAASEQAEALAWLAENDPRQAAVVEGGPDLSGLAGMQEASVSEYTPNRIVVQAEGPGLLVLSEVYDPDWHARVAGQEVDVLRADGVLRAVTLDSGLQQVEFAYRPAGLWVGVSITALGWAGVAALCCRGWWVRRG